MTEMDSMFYDQKKNQNTSSPSIFKNLTNWLFPNKWKYCSSRRLVISEGKGYICKPNYSIIYPRYFMVRKRTTYWGDGDNFSTRALFSETIAIWKNKETNQIYINFDMSNLEYEDLWTCLSSSCLPNCEELLSETPVIFIWQNQCFSNIPKLFLKITLADVLQELDVQFEFIQQTTIHTIKKLLLEFTLIIPLIQIVFDYFLESLRSPSYWCEYYS